MTQVEPEPELRSAMQRLTLAPDGAEYIIGRADLGVYVAIPRPGAVLIEALRDGASIARATELASGAAGEDVDASDFLAGLREAGLLEFHDGAQMVAKQDGMRIGWVERIPQAAVKPLFGRIAWTFYAAAALEAIVLLVVRPDLRPIFDDIWFLSDPIWSVLALFAISVAITAGHECWHWLAGRAVGVPARFRVSRRGVFVVFETQLSQLATVPRRARYSPILAGVAFDVVLFALALTLRLCYRNEILSYPPELDRLLGALVFRQLVILIWQLAGVAFRSDGYVLLANALGCHNLYRATTLTAKYRLWKLSTGEAEELDGISPRDRSVARWFWLVYLAGLFAMFMVFVAYFAPFTYGMTLWIVPNIRELAPTTLVFWQSLAVVALLVGQYAALPLIGSRQRRRRRRAQPAAAKAPRTRTVKSPLSLGWQAMLVVLLIYTSVFAWDHLQKYTHDNSDATGANLVAKTHDDSCLPGQAVPIMNFPHISRDAAARVVYNSNPATSGPHYGAAIAPGIYRTYLPNALTVHSMEHGRVVIHYRPDTPDDVVDELKNIAKRFTRYTLMQPNPHIDAQIVLTAFGRIEKLDAYDKDRIVTFVKKLHGRYNHRFTIAANECRPH